MNVSFSHREYILALGAKKGRWCHDKFKVWQEKKWIVLCTDDSDYIRLNNKKTFEIFKKVIESHPKDLHDLEYFQSTMQILYTLKHYNFSNDGRDKMPSLEPIYKFIMKTCPRLYFPFPVLDSTSLIELLICGINSKKDFLILGLFREIQRRLENERIFNSPNHPNTLINSDEFRYKFDGAEFQISIIDHLDYLLQSDQKDAFSYIFNFLNRYSIIILGHYRVLEIRKINYYLFSTGSKFNLIKTNPFKDDIGIKECADQFTSGNFQPKDNLSVLKLKIGIQRYKISQKVIFNNFLLCKQQLEKEFDETYLNFAQLLLSYLQLTDPKVIKEVLGFTTDRNLIEQTRLIIETCPDAVSVCNNDPDLDLLAQVIEKQHFELATLLLEKGWTPNKKNKNEGKASISFESLMDLALGENSYKFSIYRAEENILKSYSSSLLNCGCQPTHDQISISDYSVYSRSFSSVLHFSPEEKYKKLLWFFVSYRLHDLDDMRLVLKKAIDLKLMDIAIFIFAHHSKLISEYNSEDRDLEFISRLLSAGYLPAVERLYQLGFRALPASLSNGRSCNNIQSHALSFFQSLSEKIACAQSDAEKNTITNTFKLMFERGANVNDKFDTRSVAEINCTLLEYCYLHQGQDRYMYREMAHELLQRGAIITPRVSRLMKLEIQAGEGKLAIEYLIKQNCITPIELELLVNPPKPGQHLAVDLANKVLDAKFYLEKHLPLCHLNPNLIDLSEIAKIRMLKKEVKAFLQDAANLKDSKRIQLQSIYNPFCSLYDQLVNKHLLLHELRLISREIRSLALKTESERKISRRLSRFYSLWSYNQSYGKKQAELRIPELFSALRKQLWKELYNRTVSVANRVSKEQQLALHKIVWLHGTKSSSLPSILASGGLVPMGMLIEKGGAAFSGEICGSHHTINKNSMSGEMLTFDWEAPAECYFDANSNFIVNLIYALKEDGYAGHETYFDPKKSWQRVTVEHLEMMLNYKVNTSWDIVQQDILRLRMTDPEADKKLAPYKEKVEELLKSEGGIKEKEIERINNALNVQLSYKVLPEHLSLIQAAYPIIFASTTVEAKPLNSSHRYAGEFLAPGKIALGTDLQIAFTIPEKVKELQGLLKPMGIQVFDLETALHLETMQMIHGSRDRAKMESETPQISIAHTLQQDILPHYVVPYPKDPWYSDPKTKERCYIKSPHYGSKISSHEEYMRLVNDGRILPRNIHGPMHAAQVALLTQLLLHVYEEKEGPLVNINRYLLGVAGATHDIGRMDDGKDYWDNLSAEIFRGILQSKGYTIETLKPYIHAIAEKDPEGKKFTSVEQQILHDADVLAIMRCLDAKSSFKKEELCCYKFEHLSFNKDLLIDEILEFVLFVEKPETKEKFEKSSVNFYGDLMVLLDENKARFPLMSKMLRREISVFTKMNDKE